jgi:SAM-dependent methyltransferase
MNTEFYQYFFKIQKKHWWFVTKKEIVLKLIKKHFSGRVGAKVLDIGCGSGLMLNALEEVGQTFGMDVSDVAINFSKEIFIGEVKKGELPDKIPYEKEFFDLITALDVIEHIDRDIDSLKAIHSLLAQGGKAIITVPAYMFLWSSFDELNEHKRRYTVSELNKKLEQAGFTIERISYYNTLLFPVILTVRIINSILNRDASTELNIPNVLLNFFLKKIFGFEKFLLNFINLPYGVSILAVVRK